MPNKGITKRVYNIVARLKAKGKPLSSTAVYKHFKSDKIATVKSALYRIRKRDGLLPDLAAIRKDVAIKNRINWGLKVRADPEHYLRPDLVLSRRPIYDHIISNLEVYQEVPPLELCNVVYRQLVKTNPDIKWKTINKVIKTLRQFDLLPDLPIELTSRSASQKQVAILRGVAKLRNAVRLAVERLRRLEVPESEMTVELVMKHLPDPNIGSEDVLSMLKILRGTKELQKLSPAAFKRSIILRSKRQEERVLRGEIPGRSTRARAFIREAVVRGYSPELMTPKRVFEELKDKIDGLTYMDVKNATYDLHAEGVLPVPAQRVALASAQKKVTTKPVDVAASIQPEQIVRRQQVESVVEPESRKVGAKVVDETYVKKKADYLISVLRGKIQKYPDVFFDILHEILLGKSTAAICKTYKAKGSIVQDLDVATVAHVATIIFEKLYESTPQLRPILNICGFWNRYFSEYRSILHRAMLSDKINFDALIRKGFTRIQKSI